MSSDTARGRAALEEEAIESRWMGLLFFDLPVLLYILSETDGVLGVR
jgi:hypothetical protein